MLADDDAALLCSEHDRDNLDLIIYILLLMYVVQFSLYIKLIQLQMGLYLMLWALKINKIIAIMILIVIGIR